jgi:WD40 repeat protein
LPIAADGTVEGSHRRLTAGTGLDDWPTVVTVDGTTHLYYSSSRADVGIWRLPVEVDRAEVTGVLERLTSSVGWESWPTVSADGTKLAYQSNQFGNADVWLRDLASGEEIPLTTSPEHEWFPQIGPDGSRVAFVTGGNLFVVTDDGGVPTRIAEDVGWITDWPAEETILVKRNDGIARLDPGSGSFTQLVQDEDRNFYFAVASPDRKWFSFMEWISADRTRLLVAPLGEAPIPESEWIPVTEDTSVVEENAWSPDGTILYYVSERDGHRCLWAQPLDPDTRVPQGEPVAMHHSHQLRQAIASTADSPHNMDLTADAVYFAMQEVESNIWRATIER